MASGGRYVGRYEILPRTARLRGKAFIHESLAESTPDNAGWALGGTNATASLTGGSSDPTGAGPLRLTSVGQQNIAGYAYYNVPFTLTKGLIVSFDYACWGGVNSPFGHGATGPVGADGSSF